MRLEKVIGVLVKHYNYQQFPSAMQSTLLGQSVCPKADTPLYLMTTEAVNFPQSVLNLFVLSRM